MFKPIKETSDRIRICPRPRCKIPVGKAAVRISKLSLARVAVNLVHVQGKPKIASDKRRYLFGDMNATHVKGVGA